MFVSKFLSLSWPGIHAAHTELMVRFQVPWAHRRYEWNTVAQWLLSLERTESYSYPNVDAIHNLCFGNFLIFFFLFYLIPNYFWS